MIPRKGPSSYSCRGITDVSVPAGGEISAVWRWPRALFVTGFLAHGRGGTRAELAALTLRIQDETFQDVFSDGQGASFARSLLSLCGLVTTGPLVDDLVMVRPWVMQRPVAAGDEWVVTVANTSGAPIYPELHWLFEEPER